VKERPNFYAIIPANVRYNKNITANAKLLYGEITALCSSKGYCWSTNEYFSKLYGVSKKSISSWVSQLSLNEFVSISIEYKEGSNEIFHRYIRILPGGMEEKVKGPMEEKVKDNNTSINTTINNTVIKDDFDKLWKTYDKKVDKKRACDKYLLLRKKNKIPPIDELITIILSWNKTKKWTVGEGKYKPHLTTWLNQERWEDEIPKESQSNGHNNNNHWKGGDVGPLEITEL